ncbi:MAG: signal peptide peptidase SppA [Thermoguttaceae bacterium]
MSTTPHPEGTPPPQPAAVPQAAPGVHYYYPPPPPPPRRGFWGRLFLTFFVLLLGGSFFLNLIFLAASANLIVDGTPRVQEKFVSHDKSAEDKVAILPIEGIIMEAEDGFAKRAIDTAMKDDHVKAVVLRVDSPGGSVSGSDYLYHHLCKLAETKKIPIVVSMGSIAASGGYYVSMAVGHEPDTIFAERTCFTGSIGVIIPHYNVAEFMKEHGLADDSIASNKLKEMGSITKPMTDDEKKIFEALIKDSFEQFKNVVRSGRSEFEKEPTRLDALATGQVYTAEQAVKNKLIDKLGFLEDAVDRAIELAHLDGNKVKVVRYRQEASLSSILLGAQSRASGSQDLNALLEMTTPKAYYLVSWLPGLAGAAK